ncbi:MAG: transposase, partial [Actinobacteria bacterium]|nr:transposase [Actinomycetota bacterium]
MQETREIRALTIAATTMLRPSGTGWSVPSQSGGKPYTVDPVSRSCSCPDHETRGVACKHILAVEFTIRREKGKGGVYRVTEETVKVTCTQQWSAYNAAQCEEKDRFLLLLADLCRGIDVPRDPHRSGRPATPPSVMAFATTYKVYSRFSSRRFTSDLRNAHDAGLIPSAPHFNSVCNFMSSPGLTPVLKNLIVASSLPLKAVETEFAADSTGFSTSRFIRWFNKKYGHETDNREWIKLHAMVGVLTNVVTSAEVTGWTAADTNFFRPLLEETAENFSIEQVSADKAYLSHANVDAVEKHGAVPFIPFKSNTRVPSAKRDGAWERMYHSFALEREAFLTNYHKRSNVETTFSMIKAKFGDAVLSKSDTGQWNEALCKVLAHNICCVISAIHELGIEAQF